MHDWTQNKDRLLTELRDHITQCSQLQPPPLDYIAQLQEIRAHIQTANAEELHAFLTWWAKVKPTASGTPDLQTAHANPAPSLQRSAS